jgi:hypothetical protein
MQWWKRNWVLLCLAGCVGGVSLAQEPENKVVPITAEDLSRMNRAMAPGEPHAFLARFAGEWTYRGTAWMAPDASPIDCVGTATKAMVLEGRYLEEVLRGSFLDAPFEGRSLTGYDNLRKELRSTWADNFGTALLVFKGRIGRDGFELTGETMNPMTSLIDTLRIVVREVDADHHVVEYFAKPKGQPEYRRMELSFARRAP